MDLFDGTHFGKYGNNRNRHEKCLGSITWLYPLVLQEDKRIAKTKKKKYVFQGSIRLTTL